MSNVKRFVTDAKAIYALADKVVSCVTRPPSMDPEDVRQDAALACIEMAATLPDDVSPAQLRKTLFGRVRNRLRNQYKREFLWCNRRAAELPPVPASQPAVGPEDVEAALALCKTPGEREVVELSALGHSYKEIGAITGRTVSAVGMVLNRIHQRVGTCGH